MAQILKTGESREGRVLPNKVTWEVLSSILFATFVLEIVSVMLKKANDATAILVVTCTVVSNKIGKFTP